MQENTTIQAVDAEPHDAKAVATPPSRYKSVKFFAFLLILLAFFIPSFCQVWAWEFIWYNPILILVIANLLAMGGYALLKTILSAESMQMANFMIYASGLTLLANIVNCMSYSVDSAAFDIIGHLLGVGAVVCALYAAVHLLRCGITWGYAWFALVVLSALLSVRFCDFTVCRALGCDMVLMELFGGATLLVQYAFEILKLWIFYKMLKDTALYRNDGEKVERAAALNCTRRDLIAAPVMLLLFIVLVILICANFYSLFYNF